MDNQPGVVAPSGSEPAIPRRPVAWWHVLLRRQTLVGAVVPAGIFYLGNRLGYPLLGAVLAASWGVGVVMLDWWRTRRINALAGLAGIFSGIAIATILITRDPMFFLVAPAINNTLSALIFFGSLLFPRPVLQLLAEETGALEGISAAQRRSPAYRRCWQILTVGWGLVDLLRAFIVIVDRWWLPLEGMLIVRTLMGWPIFAAELWFSFWFPSWYWQRHPLHVEPSTQG